MKPSVPHAYSARFSGLLRSCREHESSSPLIADVRAGIPAIHLNVVSRHEIPTGRIEAGCFAVLKLISGLPFSALAQKNCRSCRHLALHCLLYFAPAPICPAAAQLRNRWLKQHEVSARISRVEPDDRTTLCGE